MVGRYLLIPITDMKINIKVGSEKMILDEWSKKASESMVLFTEE